MFSSVPCGPSIPELSASQVDEPVVEGDLGHKLPGDVLQSSGQAVLPEEAFKGGESGLGHPSPAIALEFRPSRAREK